MTGIKVDGIGVVWAKKDFLNAEPPKSVLEIVKYKVDAEYAKTALYSIKFHIVLLFAKQNNIKVMNYLKKLKHLYQKVFLLLFVHY